MIPKISSLQTNQNKSQTSFGVATHYSYSKILDKELDHTLNVGDEFRLISDFTKKVLAGEFSFKESKFGIAIYNKNTTANDVIRQKIVHSPSYDSGTPRDLITISNYSEIPEVDKLQERVVIFRSKVEMPAFVKDACDKLADALIALKG
ncbi:MAG: hypothetical protein WCY19_03965 [Candidatus Gastranaerophilaceae bacterium]